MANEYVDSTALKATLSLTGETFADADIAAACTAASRAIDQACGRRFYADANSSQVRLFTAAYDDWVEIDDLIQMTQLATDYNSDGTFETVWAATDYRLRPVNAAADGWPYTSIKVTQLTRYWFPAYEAAVQVTGKFGWSAVPAPIVDATTMYAHRLVRRKREAPFGIVTVGIDTGAAMRISRQDPDVYALITPYIRQRVMT